MPDKRAVGLDDVVRALSIREGGGSWASVIEATGFNGATLRPHITKFLQSKERLGRAAVERGDRADSPYAVVQSVELTEESIIAARKRGMAWYSISLALGVSEAKVKGLAGVEGAGRVYATSAATAERKAAEKFAADREEAVKIDRRRTAKLRREAKKAAKAA